jgi:hypothetical protein
MAPRFYDTCIHESGIRDNGPVESNVRTEHIPSEAAREVAALMIQLALRERNQARAAGLQ